MFKKLLAGLITAVLSLGAVALIAGPASAHHNDIDVNVSCAADGSYKVTWGVKNSEGDKTEVITASNLPVALNASLGFSERKEFLQFVSTPQDLSLNITGTWSNGYSQPNSGFVSAGAFPTGCIKVTASAIPSPSECTGPNEFSAPKYTLAPVTGVQYTVGASTTAGGEFPATNGTSVHIEASVTDPKYKLEGTTVWDFTFTEPTPACTWKVVPVAPDLTQAICKKYVPGEHELAFLTVTPVTGVFYYIKIDGGDEQPLPTGKFPIADGTKTVQVIAKADADNYYVIENGPIVYDVKTVNQPGLCLKEIIPLEPDPVNDACNALAPGVIPATTYTLFYVEHLIYMVSVNNGGPVDVILTQTTTFPVSPRDARIHVTARVDDTSKYEVKPWAWEMVFFDFGDCKTKLTPVEPLATDQFCEEDGPLQVQGKVAVALPSKVQKQGTITIPATPIGVQYFLDGNPVAAGVYTVTPGLHEVNAAAINGATTKLDPAIVLPFKFDIKPGLCEPDFLIVPAATSNQIGCFSSGSYTLSNNLNDPNAIIWTVNGTQVAPGKYTASNSSTVTIVAAPNAPTYGLVPGSPTTWTVNFAKPTVCDLETLALTGQSPTGLLIVADLFVVTGLALFAVRAMRRRPEML